MTHPIDAITWLPATSLKANSYNPNVVFTPELRLLERSLLLTGWVQPILIASDRTIIDGFHRHRLAQDSAALKARDGDKVPCAVLKVSRSQAMLLTIRMNRAKGSHVAARMHEIVRELVDKHGLDPQEIAQEIGATQDEVDLLYRDGVFAMKDIKNYAYGKAWVPFEVP